MEELVKVNVNPKSFIFKRKNKGLYLLSSNYQDNFKVILDKTMSMRKRTYPEDILLAVTKRDREIYKAMMANVTFKEIPLYEPANM